MSTNDQKSKIPSTGGGNGFLANSQRFIPKDKVKSTYIGQYFNIEPLLLRLEQSQLCWCGHVTQMSHEQTAKQIIDALPSGKRPRGRPRTCWQNWVEDQAWWRLKIPPTQLALVAGNRDA